MSEEWEQRNNFMETLVALIRPDIWEKLNKEKGEELYDNATFQERVIDGEGHVASTLDNYDFKKLVEKRQGMLKNLRVIQKSVDGEIVDVAPVTPLIEEEDNPIIVESH